MSLVRICRLDRRCDIDAKKGSTGGAQGAKLERAVADEEIDVERRKTIRRQKISRALSLEPASSMLPIILSWLVQANFQWLERVIESKSKTATSPSKEGRKTNGEFFKNKTNTMSDFFSLTLLSRSLSLSPLSFQHQTPSSPPTLPCSRASPSPPASPAPRLGTPSPPASPRGSTPPWQRPTALPLRPSPPSCSPRARLARRLHRAGLPLPPASRPRWPSRGASTRSTTAGPSRASPRTCAAAAASSSSSRRATCSTAGGAARAARCWPRRGS